MQVKIHEVFFFLQIKAYVDLFWPMILESQSVVIFSSFFWQIHHLSSQETNLIYETIMTLFVCIFNLSYDLTQEDPTIQLHDRHKDVLCQTD